MTSKLNILQFFNDTCNNIKHKNYSEIDNVCVHLGFDVFETEASKYDKEILKKYLLIYYCMINKGNHIDKQQILLDIQLKLLVLCFTDAELNGLCNLAKLYNYDYIKVLNVLDK